jgi:Zn-dependent protease
MGKTGWKQKAAKVGGGAAVGGGVVLKLLGKLAILGKALFVVAKLKTVLSMIVSVGFYAIFWGWKFAVGFVLLMLIHELGHVFVLKLQGVPVTAPMFIPFLGAFVVPGEQRSVAQEAASALAGPVTGMLASGAVLLAAESTGSGLLRALAYTGFLLNLFNLFPVLPLDGGRVAGALHPAIWIIGMVAAVGYLIIHPLPVGFIILIFGGVETWRRWRDRKAGKTSAYFNVEPLVRWQIGLSYAATAALCVIGMAAAYIVPPNY